MVSVTIKTLMKYEPWLEPREGGTSSPLQENIMFKIIILALVVWYVVSVNREISKVGLEAYLDVVCDKFKNTTIALNKRACELVNKVGK